MCFGQHGRSSCRSPAASSGPAHSSLMERVSFRLSSVKQRGGGHGGVMGRALPWLTCMFCVQVAVPPAQPAQHCQRCQAELLATEATGPEAAEAACCCHPSHCEYPLGEGWNWEHSGCVCLLHALPSGCVACMVCGRVGRTCSSLWMAKLIVCAELCVWAV